MPNNGFTGLLRRIAPNLYDPPLATRPWGDFNGAMAGALAAIPLTLAYGLIIGGALGESSRGIGVLMALYGSVVVGVLATLLGGCPFLIAGPRAATLLVFAALISHLSHAPALAQVANPAPLVLALACTSVAGAGMLKLLFGAFRLGRLADYVPLQVVAGFTNGTALLVVLSQVWAATGVPAQKSVLDLFSHLPEVRPAGLLLALATAVAMKLLPREIKRVPTILLVFAVGTAIYHFFASFGLGSVLGGTLPPAPDHFSLSFIGDDAYALLFGPQGGELIHPMVVAAVSMSILSTLDTLLATAAADGVTMRRSDANRQLMAEGIGNALAGMFVMAPGSGSMVRTQAALNGGMASAAAPIAIAVITLGVTVVLGPLIAFLPQAVMAGILISLGIDLVDKWTLIQLRRLFAGRRVPVATDSDLLVVAVVVATALIFNLATAVGMGMLLSLSSFVMQMAHSPIRRCYPATALIPGIFGDIARRNFIEQHGKHIAIIEIEGALFFGTASELEVSVDTLADDGVVHVVIDLKRVKHIDATGGRALERIHAKLSQRGGMLVVSHAGRDRRERKEHFLAKTMHKKRLSRSNWEILTYLGTVGVLGEDRFLRNTDSAVALCERHLATKLIEDAETKELLNLRSSLIQALDRSMLRRLRNYWTRVAFAPGDVVFDQGGRPDGVFFVTSGRVDVMASVAGSEYKRKVQSLTSGAVFGELALIDDMPRSTSIVATEPTTCYWVSAENFRRLKTEQTDIALAMVANVAMIFVERLRATDTMLADMEA
ncbi:MAG: STAS domain-containing protein [Rhodocyclaceae bacterium]|nr:MAG: STAS domain-containing protein [Rhodocyclaceae bacterium]